MAEVQHSALLALRCSRCSKITPLKLLIKNTKIQLWYKISDFNSSYASWNKINKKAYIFKLSNEFWPITTVGTKIVFCCCCCCYDSNCNLKSYVMCVNTCSVYVHLIRYRAVRTEWFRRMQSCGWKVKTRSSLSSKRPGSYRYGQWYLGNAMYIALGNVGSA
jgi:hypothetical protein